MRAFKFRAWIEAEKKYIRDCSPLLISDSEVVVEQYTGIKDKNGKEIYEGDLVGIPNNEEDGIEAHVFGAVVYDKNKFGVKRESPFVGEDIHFFDIWDGLEVIGNIHENPELCRDKEGNEKE